MGWRTCKTLTQPSVGRFGDWVYPEINESELTEYNWLVQHKDNLRLGYKTDIGAFTYINAKNGVVIEDFIPQAGCLEDLEMGLKEVYGLLWSHRGML